MNFNEIFERYVFNDGRVISFYLDIEKNECRVTLEIRQYISRNKHEPCKVELVLKEVFEIYIFEDFPTEGRYTDITFLKTGPGNFYLSLDPYGNSGNPHEKDNYVIKSKALTFIDMKGSEIEIY